ncbi:hypothetical protein V2J09_009583 [Rumex salicifolius]
MDVCDALQRLHRRREGDALKKPSVPIEKNNGSVTRSSRTKETMCITKRYKNSQWVLNTIGSEESDFSGEEEAVNAADSISTYNAGTGYIRRVAFQEVLFQLLSTTIARRAMNFCNGSIRVFAAPATHNRSSLLDFISRSTSLSRIRQGFAQLIVGGLLSDLITVTKLAQKLCDIGAVHQAAVLVSSYAPKPDLFLHNVLIKGYSRSNDPSSAASVFARLRTNSQLRPDNFTYAFAISASALAECERIGMMLHSQAIVDGFGADLFVGSAAVGMYLSFSRMGFAHKVFDHMSQRDTVLWNTMISGLARNCCYFDSVRLFGSMIAGGCPFDSTTLAVVLPAAAELQDLQIGMGIQCLAVKVGFSSHVHVLTGLVSLHTKCGDVAAARLLFDQIRKPDLICFNAMISGYTCNNGTESSLMLFNKLIYAGVKVNSSTIIGLIPVGSPFGHLNFTLSIHGFCAKTGMLEHSSVSTALTTAYSRLNEIELARKLFDVSPQKSLASWNAMISGYAQNGLTEEAISLFQEMQVCNVHPNPVTVTSILSACAQLGALSLGKWVHELIKRESFDANVHVLTALVDMYAKCGSISIARQLFDSMPERNVVSWNAVISGYGLHGRGHEALRLFHEMSHLGITPTRVTFLGILYACSHSGLVTEGNDIFHSMVHEHGLEPLPEHYACMVDLFGRAGKLDKALEFINNMTVEPGAVVWGALLGSCMIHKNTNMAHIASSRLLELDPENVSHYVSLSNVYSSDHNYRQAALVRQVAKNKRLAKSPGCTLIEIGERPHIFKSGDRSHPQSAAIYAMLEKLMGKMKEAGYQTETKPALHDVEEEEKELMVNVHSEKLAIGFGLISTEPGTEIRIIKNLRVCLDCHNATKFISKITQRVIVVRDANRFHHFKDGVCSCGDYW